LNIIPPIYIFDNQEANVYFILKEKQLQVTLSINKDLCALPLKNLWHHTSESRKIFDELVYFSESEMGALVLMTEIFER
jgi:hypothetical protein